MSEESCPAIWLFIELIPDPIPADIPPERPPPIAPEPPEHLIGANTVAALNNGAMFGTAAMLDGLADRVETELGQPLTVVVTGGLAPYIMPCCKRSIIYDADLLFKGLALLWERNHN